MLRRTILPCFVSGIFGVFLVSVLVLGCGSDKSARHTKDPDAYTQFEIQCGDSTPPVQDVFGETVANPGVIKPIPEPLPVAELPLHVESCGGLPDGKPIFNADRLAGLVVIVDCKAKIVRFRTRDFQVNETADISRTGDFATGLIFITRLKNDLTGSQDCWARLLGQVRGHANCNPDPAAVRVDLQASWKFDMTPPEAMEKPVPGLEDLRNGQHCEVGPSNCSFVTGGALGCGGAL